MTTEIGRSDGAQLRLRQVAVVTREPGQVEDDLCAVLGLQIADRHQGVDEYGLGTAFFPLGDEFVEVVWSAKQGTAADRFIDRRGGPGGFIVMIQCSDLAEARARLDGLGCRIVDHGDSPAGRYLQVHPGDTGGVYLQLVEPVDDDVERPDGNWLYGGPDWRQARSTVLASGLLAAELQASAPHDLARVWSEVLGRPASYTAAGGAVLWLDRGAIRFVQAADGRGTGLGGIDVATPNRDGVLRRARSRGQAEGDVLLIGGLRICLRDA